MENTNDLICIDWGTSSLRAYLMGSDKEIKQVREFPWGIKNLPFNTGAREQDFKETFLSACEGWLGQVNTVMIGGMVTSANGWLETPYVACPADINDLVAGLKSRQFDGCHLLFVPGLCSHQPSADVMRGEECQIFGLLPDSAQGQALICLPGTHSKWVLVQGARVEKFNTFMTGEVFEVMSQHSILLNDKSEQSFNKDAFIQGVNVSSNNLLNILFSVRSKQLLGELKECEKQSYLSGLLIGHELQQVSNYMREAGFKQQVTLVGSQRMNQLYRLALSQLLPDIEINSSEHAAAMGLWQIAKHQKLI